MEENEYDWPNILSSFESSTVGQIIREEGYVSNLHLSEDGSPFVKVNADADYLESLQIDSPLPLMSTKPRLEII